METTKSKLSSIIYTLAIYLLTLISKIKGLCKKLFEKKLTPGQIHQAKLDEELACAVLDNNVKEARNLIEQGANTEQHFDRIGGGTLLHYSILVSEDNTGMVEMLIDKGANIEAKDHGDKTPLNLAIREYKRETAKLLMNRGADVNTIDYPKSLPLKYSARQEDEEMIRLLLEKGARIDLVQCNKRKDFITEVDSRMEETNTDNFEYSDTGGEKQISKS
jgi:ankyrin repeat protein